jgi:CheY-like chemotaxis protein
VSKRVLIVDDEDHIREVAQLSLETVAGWRVATAASGHEGLEKAAEQRPDAILLDVMMPDMDGPAVFERLQDDASTRDIPVLLLTAKVQAADRRRFADLGVAAVLSKPFDPMTLSEDVAGALGWSHPEIQR